MGLQEEQIKPGTTTENRFSAVMFLFLLAVVVVTAFLVYMKSQNLSINELLSGNRTDESTVNTKKEVSEFKYDNRDYSVFTTSNNYIIKCNRDSISGLNKSGTEEWQISVSMNKPVVKTSGLYVLVADIGGREIYVLKGNNVKWKKKLSSNIINMDINSSGYVSIIEERKGYNGVVVVFDSNGQEIFTKGNPDIYVLDAKVSPSKSQVLVNSMDASGVSSDSRLEIMDIYGDSIDTVEDENEIFPLVRYMDDDKIFAVSDTTAKCFDSDREELWPECFKGDILSSNVSLGRYPVIAARKEGESGLFGANATNVIIYNTKGLERGKYEVSGEVRNIETYSDIIALQTDGEVYFINTRGKLVGKYSSQIDIIGVHFLSKSEAVVITTNTVKIIKIR